LFDELDWTVVAWSAVVFVVVSGVVSSAVVFAVVVFVVAAAVVLAEDVAADADDVACPACAASPAKRPVPASAPDNVQRVMLRTRRRPASRSCLLLTVGLAVMPTILDRDDGHDLRVR
jgi:hypothetical protein